jgi:hypothetical protein
LTVSISAARRAHADEDPLAFLSLRYEGECDKENRHLWVTNSHPTKSVLATIRWHLAKSTRVVSDQFQIAPAQTLEIGCAAQSDIASVQFVP